MMLEKYLENDGIAVHSYEDACTLAKVLLDNGNAVMITEEEDLYIVTYVWCESGYSERNDVVFRCRSSVEIELWQNEKEDE